MLQNAFVSPGLAFAGNYGAGSGQSFFGAAAAWGLSGGRFQVSAAAGSQNSRSDNRGAYGGRASINVWTSSSGGLGAGAFLGVGGGPRTRDGAIVTNPAVLTVPLGVSLGYKRGIGTTRGFSLFVTPFYAWTRTDSGTVASNSAFRFSTGLDFVISQSFGVTVGGEFGGNQPGAAGNSFGAALTFAPGRR